MRFTILFSALAASLSLTATAQVTNVAAVSIAPAMSQLSLDDAVRLALEHNLDIQVQRYNPVISEYDRRALYGIYDPVFSAKLGHYEQTRPGGGINVNTGNDFPGTHSEVDAATFGLSGVLPTGLRYDLAHNISESVVTTPGIVGSNSLGAIYGNKVTDTYDSGALLTLNQPLLRDFWIDSSRLSIQLARRSVRMSELDVERSIMLTITAVEKAYYGLIAARETVLVRESDVALKQQFYEEQRRRVEVGALAPLEEKLAQSELSLAQTALLLSRNDAATAATTLKSLIHDDFVKHLGTRVELTDKLIAMPATPNLQDAFKAAAEKRPDLQSTRIKLERLDIQLKFDKNQLYPQLDLFGTYGVNGVDSSLGRSLDDLAQRSAPQHSYGIILSVPLSMKREREKLKSDKAAKAQAILMFQALEEGIFFEVESGVRLMRTYWEAIPLTRDRIEVARAALEAEQKKLNLGKSTSFNVLKLTTDLTSAQLNEILALKTYNDAAADLAASTGTTFERRRIVVPKRDVP